MLKWQILRLWICQLWFHVKSECKKNHRISTLWKIEKISLKKKKDTLSNQLFSDFFSKDVTFTKFLPKKWEQEFPQFPHCVHQIHTLISSRFFCDFKIFREIVFTIVGGSTRKFPWKQNHWRQKKNETFFFVKSKLKRLVLEYAIHNFYLK